MTTRTEVILKGQNICPTCGALPYWEVTELASLPGTVWRCLNGHEWRLVGEAVDCAWCGDPLTTARQVGDDTVCEDCYTEGYVRDQV